MAIVIAAPALKPSSTVSLMKLTSELRLNSQASTQMAAKTRAVRAEIWTHRAGSPPAMPATVVPTSIEIAEVGPMASCRDEPKHAYRRPPKR